MLEKIIYSMINNTIEGEVPIRLVLLTSDIPLLKRRMKKLLLCYWVYHIDKHNYSRKYWMRTDRILAINTNQFTEKYGDTLGRKLFRTHSSMKRGRVGFRADKDKMTLFVNSIFISTPENIEKVQEFILDHHDTLVYHITDSELKNFSIERFKNKKPQEFDYSVLRYFALVVALRYSNGPIIERKKLRKARSGGEFGVILSTLLSYETWSDAELKNLANNMIDPYIVAFFKDISEHGILFGTVQRSAIKTIKEEEWEILQYSGLFQIFEYVDFDTIRFKLYPLTLELLDWLFRDP